MPADGLVVPQVLGDCRVDDVLPFRAAGCGDLVEGVQVRGGEGDVDVGADSGTDAPGGRSCGGSGWRRGQARRRARLPRYASPASEFVPGFQSVRVLRAAESPQEAWSVLGLDSQTSTV